MIYPIKAKFFEPIITDLGLMLVLLPSFRNPTKHKKRLWNQLLMFRNPKPYPNPLCLAVNSIDLSNQHQFLFFILLIDTKSINLD